MNSNSDEKLLFVINAGAGANDISWQEVISNYFTEKKFLIEYFMLPSKPDVSVLKDKIDTFKPHKVIAVGGDGTVTMVAKLTAGTDAALGILPGGSANGMAKELNIPVTPQDALAIIETGYIRCCDAIKINEKDVCLHLSDIGLNAQLIKYFDEGNLRGKWGYARVIFKTLWRSQKIRVAIKSKDTTITRDAFMVVLANASKYGTGAVINPEGRLDDGAFEVVIIKQLSLIELFKMLIRPKKFNPDKTEMFHATSIKIETKRRMHFQIDGEYMGKVKTIYAEILPDYLNMILPE